MLIIVQGFMKVNPDDFAQYKRRIGMHATEVRQLDGCLHYSLSEDPGAPGVIWVSERWRDKAAQAAHLAGDHMGQFNQFMKHMPINAAHIVAYEVAGEGQWLMRVGDSKPV